jgi:phage tail-like protein
MAITNTGGKPLPKSRFSIHFGGDKEVGFQQVTGLEPTTKHTSRIKMPGIHKANDITLKRGVIASDAGFWNWYKHSGKPRTVVIKRLDETGKAFETWTLTNARPVKVTAPDLNAKGSDVAIEEIVIEYESLKITP